MSKIKDITKELTGKSLGSFHRKTGLNQLERNNEMQDGILSGMLSQVDDGYITKTEQSNVIHLENSGDGVVVVDSIEGETLVNYCTDGNREFSLNGEIDLEGTAVSTTEGVDNGLVDVVCEGNTLVNLAKPTTPPIITTKTNFDSVTMTDKGTYIEYRFINAKNVEVFSITDWVYRLNIDLVANKTYTAIVPMPNAQHNRSFLLRDNVAAVNYSSPHGANIWSFTPAVNGQTKYVFYTYCTSNYSIGDTVIVNFPKQLIILEGDWTNKEIPPYFEGLKSVGQDDTNGHGIEITSKGYTESYGEELQGDFITYDGSTDNDLVEITEIWGNTWQDSDGKNLFDESILVSNTYNDRRTLLFNNKVQVTNPITYSFTREKHGEIYLRKGTYNLSMLNVSFSNDSEKIYTAVSIETTDDTAVAIVVSTGGTTYNFEVLKDATYNIVTNVLGTYTGSVSFNIQLEEGTVATAYEPYYKADLSNIQHLGELYVDELGEPILDSQGRQQYKVEIDASETRNLLPTVSERLIAQPVVKVKLEKGKTYTIFSDIATAFQLWYYPNANMEFVNDINYWKRIELPSESDRKTFTFTVDETWGQYFSDYFYICNTWTDILNTIDVMFSTLKARMFEGTIDLYSNTQDSRAFTYEEIYVNPQSSKTAILLPYQLMKVGDVYDRLYWDSGKGKYVVEKNVGVDSLNHLGISIIGTHSLEHTRTFFKVPSDIKKGTRVSVIKGVTNKEDRSKDIFSMQYDTETMLLIRKSLIRPLDTENITDNDTKSYVQKLLSENDYTLYYQRETPQYIETNITKPIQLPTYADKTHIFVSGNISCSNMKYKYITVTGSKQNLNSIKVPLSEPLRGLPDGVKDRFVKREGKWYVERNCGEIVFDGSENWIKPSAQPINTSRYLFVGFPNNPKTKIISTMKVKSSVSEDEVGIWCDTNTIINASLNVATVEDFKIWLQANPVKVVYQLATPIYEPLTLSPELQAYLDITHISNSSLIPCNMKVKNTGYNAIIKPSTQYTVVVDTQGTGALGINLGGSKATSATNKVVVTTPATLTDNELKLTGKGLKAGKIRVLEGDKTILDCPYFEGLQSSFEEKLQNDGKYEVEIVSNNKNLFDIDFLSYNLFPEYKYKKAKFKLNSNKDYVIKGALKKTTNKRLLVGISNIPRYMGSRRTMIDFSTGSKAGQYQLWPISSTNKAVDVYYSLWYEQSYGSYNDFVKYLHESIEIQLEEGSTATSYVPQQCNKVKILLNEPLRAVGDVKDRFCIKDGKLVVERVVGQKIVTGNDAWEKLAIEPSGLTRMTLSFDNCNIVTTTDLKYLMNDKLPIVTFSNSWNLAYNCIAPFTNGIIAYIKCEGTGANMPGFKQWFNNNNIKFVYKLAEPYYEEVTNEYGEPIVLEGYEKGTVIIDSTITPTTTVRYTPKMEAFNACNEIQENNVALSSDINDNIITYMMEVDYMITEKELRNTSVYNITQRMEVLDMTSMQKRTYDMLARLIKGKSLTQEECETRITVYLSAAKITSEQAEELMLLISETYQ